jgi:hypothetical protein
LQIWENWISATAPSSAAALAPSAAGRVAAVVQKTPTQTYVDNFNPARYVQRGTDLANPDYTREGAARRVGKPSSQIVAGRDYDFARIKAVETRLAGVDRLTALRAIFNKVTAGAKTNLARHLAMLRFLQQAGIHNPYLMPVYSDRTMVQDPLVLLELGEMYCGQVSRLAVDLFDSAGYQGRVVQLNGHAVAEIYYDMKWHYFDADVFGNGDTVYCRNGSIPSLAELSRTPYLIDSLPSYWEPRQGNEFVPQSYRQPSYHYFSRTAWVNQFKGTTRTPCATYKIATAAQARASRRYGWEYAKSVDTPDRLLPDIPAYYAPAAPTIASVTTWRTASGAVQVTITWNASFDFDHDLAGYRVLVSRQSRGWNYNGQSLPTGLMSLKSSSTGWTSAKYAARFTLPKSEVFSVRTTKTSQVLQFNNPGNYFISIMPYDAHGQTVGRTLYPLSEEVRVTI